VEQVVFDVASNRYVVINVEDPIDPRTVDHELRQCTNHYAHGPHIFEASSTGLERAPLTTYSCQGQDVISRPGFPPAETDSG